MPRVGLTSVDVVASAAELADEVGYGSLTMGLLADRLGFTEVMHPAPTFAMLALGALRLVLSAPSSEGGGGQAMPDGTRPAPGGWNRIMLEVSDLQERVEALSRAGVRFRNEIVVGVGGNQILLRLANIRTPLEKVRWQASRNLGREILLRETAPTNHAPGILPQEKTDLVLSLLYLKF